MSSNASCGDWPPAGDEEEDEDDPLDIQQIDTVEAMQAFGDRIKNDQSYRRKLRSYISSIGWTSINETVRRVLRKFGTNGLWSKYSLRGRKGKIAFIDHSLCAVLIKAYRKSFPKITVVEIEESVADGLKYAPKQLGGPKYKGKAKAQKRIQAEKQYSDSD